MRGFVETRSHFQSEQRAISPTAQNSQLPLVSAMADGHPMVAVLGCSKFAGTRTSALGQTATFGSAWRCVWNASVNRHSGSNVGNAAVNGPSSSGR